jgi:arylsulfatase A-like enzyme/Tfp pilus assembly protein PilF
MAWRGAAWGTVALAVAGAILPSVGCRPARVSGKGANLLLVTIDTLRADHVGAYGCSTAATPNLDGLAAAGVRFANAGSPVPLTLPAHASILSGLLPPHHGVRLNGAGTFPGTGETLATRLKAAGYRTGAFVAAFVLDRRFGLDRSFDRYDDDIPRETVASLEAERPGRVVVDRALAWLAERDERPFFAWVHLYEPHAPYAPPEPFATRFAAHPYDGEIAEADLQLGRLLQALEADGRAARTVVAVTGDHGEELGEHGELTHGLLLYEPALHVPVLLRAPGMLPAGWVVDSPASLVDLAPTLLGLLEQGWDPGGLKRDGRNLAAKLGRREEPDAVDVYAESEYPASFGWSPTQALRRGSLKYIAAPRAELYDLTVDASEKRNLAQERAADAAPMASSLAAIHPGEAKAAPELDEETRAKLASLGYLAGARLPETPARSRKDPKDVIALFRGFEESHAAMVAGHFSEARQDLERILAADGDNSVFIGQLGEVCRRSGDLPRAIELYRQAVRLAPTDADAHYNLAVTLQEAGRQEEAFEALSRAIQLDPRRPEAHNALGIALLARGDLENALDQFRTATSLDAHNARAFNNLGNVLRDLKQLDEAEPAYRRAIELAPGYADSWNGLGALEVQRGHFARAIECFDKALAISPTLHEARLNRGIAAELSGDRPAAAAAYRDFLAKAAGDPQFSTQRTLAQRLLARLEEAPARSQENGKEGSRS